MTKPPCAHAPITTMPYPSPFPTFGCCMTSFVEWRMSPSIIGVRPGRIAAVRVHHDGRSTQVGAIARDPRGRVTCPQLIGWRDARETAHVPSSVASLRFFSQAQPHVAGSARSASVATNIPSRNARMQSSGMVQQVLPEKARVSWSRQTASRFASTGRPRGDALPSATPIDTDAQGVEDLTTELRGALEHRRCNPLTPYIKEAWVVQLLSLGLEDRYPHLMRSLAEGFDLGVPLIRSTYAPPNHQSIQSLTNVYTKIIDNEFTSGRYIGPFTRDQLELALGPFQSSPLSFVPKTSNPGVYQAVHNFSHPHEPSPNATSINSHIKSNDFPCTWGTFSTVALLIARLPPGSQASIRDVVEAYRTIPALPAQWPGLVIRLQADDQFAVNICNNFGLSSAGGAYGMLADAGADIFRGKGMGPLAKWVDDHIFFRILRTHLPSYNTQRADWHCEVQTSGGRRQEGGRLWYGGKELPSGRAEEFDEDCSTSICDLSLSSPRSPDDREFTYADADIDELSSHLSIKWQSSKSIPFGEEVPYLGFRWNLRTQVVYLPEEKKVKYLAAIAEWRCRRTHNLIETQQLHGKLVHAALVIPAGRAHLTSLEAMLSSFNNRPFRPHTPPRGTPDDLSWWQRQLRRASIAITIPKPQPLIKRAAYSDASSGFGVAITVGERWRAWHLAPGWKSQGRDIQWAEAIRFELLTICIFALSSEGDHIVVYGDNHAVVEGWWKGCSANGPTNQVFRRILQLSEDCSRTVHTRYIPSAQNPANPPSRGDYPPRSLMLGPVAIPRKARPLLIDV